MRAGIVLAVLLAAWSPPQQDIGWLKLDQAKAIASHTNKLILVVVTCDPRSGSAPCNGGAVERICSEAAIVKRQEEFHFVRVCEKKTAQLLRATKPPEAIILDGDGDEVFRSGFSDAGTLESALSSALLRYSPREIRWASEIPAGSGGKPLLIIGFDDEKGESLKAFEDRGLVKYHDRIEFVKFPVRKDSEAAKKWGVSQGPAIFICDGGKENPEKNPLEKLTGKKTPAALKSAIQKAFLRVETKK
ncbi:MAG TPA: hypothetical protein VMU54_06825 [Planctomycetota bacterium]|nr:hypothetical protein [Planctomycetota bacterium]